MKKYTRKFLKKRWLGEEDRVSKIIDALLKKEDWTVFLVDDKSHELGNLEGVDDSRLHIADGNKAARDLRGIELENLNLANNDELSDTYFNFAMLTNLHLSDLCLSSTFFYGATIRDLTLNKVTLDNIDFRKSTIKDVNFNYSNMTSIQFDDAKLENIDMIDIEASYISFNIESAFSLILKPFGLKSGTRFKKIQHDLNKKLININDECFFRFLKEEKNIDAIHNRSKVFAVLFYIFTNYGRSFTLLFLWVLTVWLGFGFLYSGYPIPDYITNNTLKNILTYFSPTINWTNAPPSPYYFSAITLVTLSYGDMLPLDGLARFYCALEAVIGYVLLGMLVSMIFHILSRNDS